MVIGCGQKHHAKGQCKMHYGRKAEIGGKPNKNKNNPKRLRLRQKTADGIPFRQLPEYNSWIMCQRRCYDKKQVNYDNYGGRGIKVCNRWRERVVGFKNFLDDMGRKPSDDCELDRIDADKNYCPENCRWLPKEHNLKEMHKANGHKVGEF